MKGPAEWWRYSACIGEDPDIFFPDAHGDSRAAKVICARCQVRGQCLEYAITNNEHYGIWGGLGLHAREKVVRNRRMDVGTYTPKPIRHGTEGGYRSHLRRGEVPCQGCRQANAEASLRYGRGRSA